ncbi:MAG: hypothetical protein LBN71_01375 [Tannerella sp.]|nr:hypothetical protein [Tannerella sp.]
MRSLFRAEGEESRNDAAQVFVTARNEAVSAQPCREIDSYIAMMFMRDVAF